MNLSCPVCHTPLTQQARTLRCAEGHQFDQARQGYWNLLLAHKKRSKDPGDNAGMVQARREFLEQDNYRPLSDAVNNMLLDALTDITAPRVLDMGCGEGYYTAAMAQALSQAHPDTQLIGLDISKHAVKAACARNRDITWLVASGADMPVPQHSQDGLTVLFSRLMPEAFHRVLKPGAFLLLAWPGEQHLIEMRNLIYSEIRPSQYDPVALLAEHFSLQQITPVQYSFILSDQESIRALLAMTPHSQRLSAEARERFESLSELTLTLDVKLGLFRRL